MKTIYTIVFLFLVISAQSQNLTQTVKGKIIDIDSKTPLPGATVVLLNSNPLVGVTSDHNGHFRFNKVPVGRQSFKISFLGYEDVFLNEVLVASGREVVFNIKMKEALTNINEVKVVANKDRSKALNSMATISAQQITIEETSRVAAGINDPGRTAQSFAGVSAADDENNELVIRGNSPRGMLYRIEGIEIPNPNHFSNGEGGSGGGVCVLSTQVLDNSDFFTGAFPAEYGNALSGVFDLNFRNGNAEKREYALQMGVMGAQVAAEGPFKMGSQASYLVNYRYSTLEMLGKMGIDISGGDIIPVFQDLSYKIYLPTKKAGNFSLWGLSGMSDAGSTPIMDSTLWEYRSDNFGETEKHRLMVNGITHNYIFKNQKTYLRTVAVYSHVQNQVIVDSIGHNYIETKTQHQDFKYGTFSVNSFVNHKFNAQHVIRTGATFHNRSFNVFMDDYDFDEKYLERLVSNSGSTNSVEGYLQWQYRINKKVDLNTGLHATYLALNNDYAIEPRLGLKWKMNETNTLNFGAGLHSRTEPISMYLGENINEMGDSYYPNKNLKITKAAHLVLGYNWNFAPDFRFKTELYYQYLYDVPVQIDDTTGTVSALNFSSGYTNEPFNNEGTGRNYGVEFTLQKFFSKNYYLLATASLFESKYKMPGYDERNTLFNSKYIYNFVGGKEFKVGKNKQNIIGANIRLIWRGGYRTTPVNLAESVAQNDDIRDYSQAFETKIPDYFRVDIGTSFRKNNPKWSWIVSLDIQNASARSNVWGEYYSTETQQIEAWYMIGFVPVLNYRIEF